MYVGIALAVIIIIVVLAVLEAKYCMKKKTKTKVKPLNSPSHPASNHAQVRTVGPNDTVHFRNTTQVAPPAYNDSAPPAYDDINNSNNSNNDAQRFWYGSMVKKKTT